MTVKRCDAVPARTAFTSVTESCSVCPGGTTTTGLNAPLARKSVDAVPTPPEDTDSAHCTDASVAPLEVVKLAGPLIWTASGTAVTLQRPVAP